MKQAATKQTASSRSNSRSSSPLTSWKFVDHFDPLAKELRKSFESRFQEPLKTRPERFVWDYWNVPGQYRLLRSPAEHVFGPRLYRELEKSLILWGQQNLGCSQVSPIWISAYVDGFEQRLHCDNGHGPWAFVWSIGPKRPQFEGGQTKILKPEVLEFWKHHQAGVGLEEAQLFKSIDPKFNRLVVFDPRIPHGVATVRGVQDLLEARLVLHGWFTNPEPVLSSGLSPQHLARHLGDLMQAAPKLREIATDLTGTVCPACLHHAIGSGFKSDHFDKYTSITKPDIQEHFYGDGIACRSTEPLEVLKG